MNTAFQNREFFGPAIAESEKNTARASRVIGSTRTAPLTERKNQENRRSIQSATSTGGR